MRLIDSHTHIYAEEFDEDIDEVIARAMASGVERMVLPNVDCESYPRMMALAERYPEVLYPSAGLHPTSVGEDYREQLDFVAEALKHGRFVAVGEIGLDYYWDTTYKEQQAEAFAKQIALSHEYDLPIIIHTREAFADTFDLLRRAGKHTTRGVFHSFTGTEAELEEALGFGGFMIGLNGVVTFKNSQLKTYIQRIPLERLLIETDAPYLSPVPKRGRRNEPAHLVHTLEFLAGTYGCSADELGEVTSQNAERLFRLG
ncbi:MAG: TatD family hydrolase [Porphyromonadaceae bacterium]|nr:TatD family hydrolase [Porphyromonadaceae bacterium]